MAVSLEEFAHREWLGYVQPVGLVVSVPALLSAQCYINKNISREQQRLIDLLPKEKDGTLKPEIVDFPLFVREVLSWDQNDLVLFTEQHSELEVVLPQYRETLQPTYFIPTDPKSQNEIADGKKSIASVLVKVIPLGQNFDETLEADSHQHWQASPQSKFERLLRETNVGVGILTNGTHLRLIYAPRGESSGYMTFAVSEMASVAGRPIFSAMHALLCVDRLFLVAMTQRLPAILSDSRKYQNTVSTQLAEQVMSALFELLRGLQAANDQSRGELLRGVLADDPNEVYRGLLTVLMRLVFVLYAEDRGLLSDDSVYVNHYSVTGLFDRLRSDAGRYPDTMEQRYGAWAQLLTLFRMVFYGARHNSFTIPARSGYLFDPKRFPFLEGDEWRGESGVWSLKNQNKSEELKDGGAELSRFGSMAKGDGSLGKMLSSDEAISEGGAVRDDQPDSTGIGLDSSEYSRGTSAPGNQRISEFLRNSEGFAYGSGNTLDSQPAGRSVTGDRFGQPSNPDRPDQSNVGGTAKVARKATVTQHTPHSTRPTPQIPLIPDGVIFRVLSNLLILDGERLSYRSLDVEQIGSVYETIMGFNIEVAQGKSIAIKPVKSHGAPSTINLESLLAAKPADRIKLLKELSDQSLTGQALDKMKSAKSIDDLLDALDRKIAKNVTPNIVPAGAMIFQPSDERRRSGSHYTPRALTEPIVRTTLKPILDQLSEKALQDNPESPTPSPQSLLSLKICDPAMGSGAFLVEACRQLADEVVAAWSSHQSRPTIPLDEDEILHARRLVAQRCLYGVDKNPMAVDLAKLSLWLATLAKDHPFTFLDHALRCGDSLVGLTRQQIIGFDLKPKKQLSLFETEFRKKVERATAERRSILEAGDDMLPGMKEQKLKIADEALSIIRLAGDAVVASFFSASKPKERTAKRDQLAMNLEGWVRNADFAARQEVSFAVDELRSGQHAIEPFHWEIEFPEVFLGTRDSGIGSRDGKSKSPRPSSSGFDCIVGNPPFAGKNTLINGNREHYLDWLQELHEESHGNADLVSHFFRQSFTLLRSRIPPPLAPFSGRGAGGEGFGGAFGLIATNTIGQGDTRSTGLRWICNHGGEIYQAQRRFKWPGQAAVVVSVVNISKGDFVGQRILDAKPVDKITAFLFHRGGHDNPATLKANAGKSFQGSIVLGMGFTFDDTDTKGVASSIAEMHRLIEKNPKNAERIFPYIGGEEINTSPTHAHHRYVINFEQFPMMRVQPTDSIHYSSAALENASKAERVPIDYALPVAFDWPDLIELVEQKMKNIRASHSTAPWWQFERPRSELYRTVKGMTKVLCTSQTGNCQGFCFVPEQVVWSHTAIVFPTNSFADFGAIQSRVHLEWARFLGATMKDDLRYLPTDCFETFPFPMGIFTPFATTENRQMTINGEDYYTYRASLMIENNEGLTKTYNRFHDPDERSPKIIMLRELHAEMDRAVLEAFGWHDLAETASCEFLLDYDDEVDSSLLTVVGTSLTTENRQPTTRKKPYRLRWPDPFRDEVLARLLELNARRHREELLAGDPEKSKPKASRKSSSKKKSHPLQRDLFE